MQTNTGKNEKKKRSKAAKIILWSLVGCIGAILLVMLIWVLIAACGGTGTSNGGILGLGFNMVTTLFGVFIVALIMTWMLTEPSFKKEEEIIVEVKQPQYVKKSARPQPVKNAPKPEPKPEVKEEAEAKSAESEQNGTPASEEKSEDDAEPDPASIPAEAESADDDIDDDDDGIDDDDDDIDDDAEDDDDIDEAPNAADIAIGAGAIGAGGIAYKYRRSFMSKLVQASDNTKGYYTDLKNKLLSYKNMRARTSWSYESFNSGRAKIAKINVRGKTLVLYLALDPAEYANTKYHIKDMSEKAKYASVPVMVRVKSPRGAKFAIELIEQVAEKKGLVANPKFAEEKYDIKYRSTEKLIEEGLIKTL